MRPRSVPALLPLALAAALPAAAGAATVRAGPLEARVSESPWGLTLYGGGRPLLEEVRNAGGGRTGRLGYRLGGRWWRATRVLRKRRTPTRWTALLATADPRGGRIRVTLIGPPPGARGGEIDLRASVVGRPASAVQAFAIGFRARPRERYLGFGERSNTVNQRGRTVENRVEEGPYLAEDYPAVAPSIPFWGLRRAADASYFPMPWLLSTRGYGVLVGNDETSRFRLGSDRRDAWSVEVDTPTLELAFLAGPRPSDVLRRLTGRTGRQPAPAAPWVLGPWFQTGHSNEEPDELDHVRLLREGDAPVSAVETHMRYMPCGADRGLEASERVRTAAFHDQGLAALTYTREAVCASYEPLYSQGVAAGAFLRRRDGSVYSFAAFVGGGVTDLAMIDFTTDAGRQLHATLLERTVANGYDGWMEDYGEYVPPDSVAADGTPGARLHNRYPALYHSWGERFTRRQGRPLARFVRSGWTGAHHGAGIVWGGDPSTTWGFDGLRSSVTQALTIGLSGIGIWGSDVGGFFTLTGHRLTRELLHRWIQFGAVSPVMRTKAQGIATPKGERPQVWEPQTLPLWRRYAKLHTQLYPYLVAAVADYRQTGLPLVRHLALAYPRDRQAAASDDQFLLGPDLLAAPVLEPGARSRRLYLPRGRWVDLWRSARYEPRFGGLSLGRVRLLRGGRRARLPAPLDELPLLVRAGAVLPLLPADVDTLADYGAGRGTVRLAERPDRELLAFPRGSSSGRLAGRGGWRSEEGARGWTLTLRGATARRYGLRASLSTLQRPFRPRRLKLGGRTLPRSAWSYDAARGVLSVTLRGRSARLRAER